MKKEETKAENSSSLEQKLELHVRVACGSTIRTFDCINALENVCEIRKDVVGAHGSGFIRADLMNYFLLGMNELISNCGTHFAMNDQPNLAMLMHFEPEKDLFLQFINAQKFDGICDGADDPVRQKQYAMIRQSYAADREAVVNNCYIAFLEKKGQKKRRLWPFYLWGASLTALCLGIAAFQVATYFTAKEMKEETNSEIKRTKDEIYSTVFRLEESMRPENIIRQAEEYFKSKEGQEYIDLKYEQFKAWWAKENLAADQFDVFWEKKVMPVLEEFGSEESDQRRARCIVDLLEQEYGLKMTADKLKEFANIFGKRD